MKNDHTWAHEAPVRFWAHEAPVRPFGAHPFPGLRPFAHTLHPRGSPCCLLPVLPLFLSRR